MIARVPLVLDPQPEGGYTVTSPLLPELITEGETVSEALANAEDAFAAVMEIYEDTGRLLPQSICLDDTNGPVSVEALVAIP
ncbi:MAG: type II toxin-antitoxin system HicB family antitoxin [Acidimicrobiaceae bacterium]|nr:type II toxin-antitoxin system HicB family antitoxin [Acidimicrobiaceae bacterium]MYA15218.1 type II toxin-antitoxin system HicB family antitoxin [Acidimicrobiaceae bacterium]MYH42484.1 type II toxin-antitoxin system HicB family antitoxin [Acidimicrobiaceae bacterium]MYI53300.1 type II toxin-antitoxin system HicB family antitoxin [Acidimicrobiaceae bacterium]MYK75246.1 type II toxin-antitoxin system HicB family antitoxin [Acidimicrobiaceae bacterium]